MASSLLYLSVFFIFILASRLLCTFACVVAHRPRRLQIMRREDRRVSCDILNTTILSVGCTLQRLSVCPSLIVTECAVYHLMQSLACRRRCATVVVIYSLSSSSSSSVICLSTALLTYLRNAPHTHFPDHLLRCCTQLQDWTLTDEVG